ncbi:MAG TPA: Ig-like domain-containing protein [Allosphingosinicella sp.]|nr:Ig-like domain-containing protein [Allosphingosinicella sp.]
MALIGDTHRFRVDEAAYAEDGFRSRLSDGGFASIATAATAPTVTRASVSLSGSQGNDGGSDATLSLDGRYLAFTSYSGNLVEGDTNLASSQFSNSASDIFVRDLVTGELTRVSLNAAGGQANGDSQDASLSSNGRFVAFESTATNLVNGDANGTTDVFVKDLRTGSVVCATVDASGEQLASGGIDAVISPDGRFVAFSSNTAVSADEVIRNIYVKNLSTGALTLVSSNAAGEQADGFSFNPSFSSNGRYVAFASEASNLVAGDTNGARDIFVKDLVTGSVRRVNTNAAGEQADANSDTDAFISADGRYVAFTSFANNLVEGMTGFNRDVYVKDLTTGEVVCVSPGIGGARANSYSFDPMLSADGQLVAFRSMASNLVADDSNFADDIFVFNLETGELTRESLSATGVQGSAGSQRPWLSADGTLLAFESLAANLAPDPSNGRNHVYVRTLVDPATDVIAPILTAAAPADGSGLFQPDGNIVLTFSEAVKIGSGLITITNGAGDTRQISVANGQVTIEGNVVTINPNADLIAGTAYRLLIPAGAFRDLAGRAFVGLSENPITFTTGNPADTTAPVLTSTSPANHATAVAVGANIVLTFDETVVAGAGSVSLFASNNTQGISIPITDTSQAVFSGNTLTLNPGFDLQPGVTYDVAIHAGTIRDAAGNAFAGIAENAFEFDTPAYGTGASTIVRASTNSIGSESNGGSNDPDFSANGRLVAFNNLFFFRSGGQLVSAQFDVYVKDLVTGVTTLVSADSSGQGVTGDSVSASISDNGRLVAFASNAQTLVPTDGNGDIQDIFLKNLATGAVTLLSVGASGVAANAESFGPALSGDGRIVAFISAASNLVANDTNGDRDVFVKNLDTGSLTRVSTTSSGGQANAETSSLLSLSTNGRFVAFDSLASNLVAGDTNRISDIFVKDLATGAITRVSVSESGGQANGEFGSGRPSLSGDGRFIVFHSDASNLVAGDPNGVSDIFVKNIATGEISLVSRSASDVQGNNHSFDPVISADGRYVSFNSDASNLVANDTNGITDVFVKDLVTGAIRLVSNGAPGTQANGASFLSTMSPDGRSVAFVSNADNFVLGDENEASDIYVRTLNRPAASDSTAPTLLSSTPSDGASYVAIGNRIFLTFSEAVRAGTGAIRLDAPGTANDVVIPIGDRSQVTFAHDRVIITLADPLAASTAFDVLIPGSAIRDLAGNAFAGLAGDALHFRTAAAAVPSLTITPEAPGGDGVYTVGEVVTFTFDFSMPVSGFTAADIDAPGGTLVAGSFVRSEADPTVYTASYRFVRPSEVSVADGAFSASAIQGSGASAEVDVVGSPGADTMRGGAEPDVLDGRGGNDVLIGAGGADTLIGGAGNDRFVVDGAADRVIEAANGGSDRVVASVSFALQANQAVELIETNNSAATRAINLTGNNLVNRLVGNAGANRLDGGAGADTLQGLAGSDIYSVDSARDRVVEAANGGNDRVLASVNYTLAANQAVEVLTTADSAGTGALRLKGNNLANSLIGNAGANVLDGGGGVDRLQGFAGNDTYHVDRATDRIIEVGGGGSDRVLASVSYRLEADRSIELLATASNAGTAAINLTGNNLANKLVGNAGANVLDGGGGVDMMEGLGGNDTYRIDEAGDRVKEATNGGRDRIVTSVSYSLAIAAGVEEIAADASQTTRRIDLTGNSLANTLIGHSNSNVLNGGAGSDVLRSFAGFDTLLFDTALGASNVDHIVDFNGIIGDGPNDTIELDSAIFTGLAPGFLSSAAFRQGTHAIGADDRIIYDQATGRLFYDRDGSGNAAAVLFAVLDNKADVISSDFLVT